jgi:hypothetical protein
LSPNKALLDLFHFIIYKQLPELPTVPLENLFDALVSPIIIPLWEQLTSDIPLIFQNTIAKSFNKIIRLIQQKTLQKGIPSSTVEPLLYLAEILENCVLHCAEKLSYQSDTHLNAALEQADLAAFVRVFKTENKEIQFSYLSNLYHAQLATYRDALEQTTVCLKSLPKTTLPNQALYDTRGKLLKAMLVITQNTMKISKNIATGSQANNPDLYHLQMIYVSILLQYVEIKDFYKEDTDVIRYLVKRFLFHFSILEEYYRGKINFDELKDPEFFRYYYDTFVHNILFSDMSVDLPKIHAQHLKNPLVSDVCFEEKAPHLAELPKTDSVLSWPFETASLNTHLVQWAFAFSEQNQHKLAFLIYTQAFVQTPAFSTYQVWAQMAWRWIKFGELAGMFQGRETATHFLRPYFNQISLNDAPSLVQKIANVIQKNPVKPFSQAIREETRIAFFTAFYQYVQNHMPDTLTAQEKTDKLTYLFETHSLKKGGIIHPKKETEKPTLSPEEELTQEIEKLTQELEKQKSELSTLEEKNKSLKKSKALENTLLKNLTQQTQKNAMLVKNLEQTLAKEQQSGKTLEAALQSLLAPPLVVPTPVLFTPLSMPSKQETSSKKGRHRSVMP